MKLIRVASGVSWANRVLGALSTGVAFALVAVVTYGVVMRYVFRSPTAFSIELPQLLFVAIIAFCLGDAQIHRKHIRVELITSRFPGKLQSALNILAFMVTAGYCVIVVWALWEKFTGYLALNEVARESRIPFAPFAFAILIGVSFLVLQLIVELATGHPMGQRQQNTHHKH